MKSYQPLVISLTVHAMLYLLAWITPPPGLFDRRPQPIEVVYQDETENKRYIVTDPNNSELEEAVNELKDRANKLSRLTKRVERESVASQRGETRNNGVTSAGDLSPRRQAPSLKQDLQSPLESEMPVAETPSEKPTIGRHAQLGVSTLAEYVPEVEEGGFTALNTDQFVHYTFYARINEQIRNRWIANLRQFIDHTTTTEISNLSQKVQIPQVEILLDPNGNFVRSILHRKSESPEIDESAIAAFRLASPLMNPPSEMVEEDGYVHLRYGFYVQFRPRYMASGSAPSR